MGTRVGDTGWEVTSPMGASLIPRHCSEVKGSPNCRKMEGDCGWATLLASQWVLLGLETPCYAHSRHRPLGWLVCSLALPCVRGSLGFSFLLSFAWDGLWSSYFHGRKLRGVWLLRTHFLLLWS